MSDVVLIYPKQSKENLTRDLRPALSLLHLAAVLKKKGYHAKIINLNINFYNWKELLDNELKSKPMFIGITALTGYMITSGLEVSSYIKNKCDIPVIWGGVHSRLEPESTIQNSLIDVVVYGEGENAIGQLVKEYSSSELKLENVKGIYYKSQNKILKTELDSVYYNLDDLPLLPFELTELEKFSDQDYLFFGFKNRAAVSFESSRGCPFRCCYCVEAVYDEKKYRKMSADRVIEHLEYIKKDYKISSIIFVDDNFFVDRERAERILNKIIEKKLNMELYSPIRSDTICKFDKPFVNLMEKAGFKEVAIGVESGSDRMLKYIGKGEKISSSFDANKLLSVTGIMTQMNFITGFPGEKIEDTSESFLAIFRFYRENKLARCCIGKLIPTPNSPVYKDCLKKGMRQPMTLEEWADMMDYNFLRKAEWLDSDYHKWLKNNWYLQDLTFRINWNRGENAVREKVGKLFYIKKNYFIILMLFANLILFLRFKTKFFKLQIEPYIFRFLINFFSLLTKLKK